MHAEQLQGRGETRLDSNVRSAIIWRLPNERAEHFDTLAGELAFPNYFGATLDALVDVPSDETWLDERGVLIVHLSISAYTPAYFVDYKTALQDAVTRLDRRGHGRLLDAYFVPVKPSADS